MNLPDPILRITDAIRTANAETGFTYFTPVADDPEVWTLCSRGVGPVFVPLVASDSNPIGLHVRAGVSLGQMEIATFDHDYHGIGILGQGLERFLICLYLHDKSTFHKWGRRSEFLAWLDVVGSAIPELLPVPEVLRTEAIARVTAGSWIPWAGEGPDPYMHARHPLAGLPMARSDSAASKALERIDERIATDNQDVLLSALRAALRRRCEQSLTSADYLSWLPYESWYFRAETGLGSFGVSAAAAPAWHAALEDGFPEVLRGTPFAPLERCPNAFNDKAGVPTLIEIADTYRDLGDRERELGTLRNAATVSLVTTHRYPAGLLERIASVCDSIEPGGFAGQVTLEYIEARKRKP